ncbi:gluconokinase [Vibrio sp. DW001]|uniref:gluconokinase n=1 Tax=Vibrio sp. DW001 TaxID=2912315 RepID=UPI0023B17C07|nr:gluconokinase [Vibrio sp. DW001]WED26751.1 gluconokinase [Vibrio sp. DW001]
MNEKKIIFVMGVSGSGKSTVAKNISALISSNYIDADDHHPKKNVDKMASGTPLNDQDRLPWLNSLNLMATECIENEKSITIACSCLKPEYREILQKNISKDTVFIYLKGSLKVIQERMEKRKGHYFSGNSMLISQFEALVEPTSHEDINFFEVDIDENTIEEVTNLSISKLGYCYDV